MGAHPTSGFDDANLILTKAGGGVFNSLSFDLDDQWTGVVDFKILGTRPDFTTFMSTYTTDGQPGYDTFSVTGYTGLQSVAFGTNNLPALQNLGLDNLLVNDYTNVVSTPVPDSLILFISGLLGLLVVRRFH